MKLKKQLNIISLSFVIVFLIFSQVFAHRNRHRYGQKSGSNLKIVCSFSDFATIIEFIAQDKAKVDDIASGIDGPHFVPHKPRYAMKLRDADIWITAGMDLEG